MHNQSCWCSISSMWLHLRQSIRRDFPAAAWPYALLSIFCSFHKTEELNPMDSCRSQSTSTEWILSGVLSFEKCRSKSKYCICIIWKVKKGSNDGWFSNEKQGPDKRMSKTKRQNTRVTVRHSNQNCELTHVGTMNVITPSPTPKPRSLSIVFTKWRYKHNHKHGVKMKAANI